MNSDHPSNALVKASKRPLHRRFAFWVGLFIGALGLLAVLHRLEELDDRRQASPVTPAPVVVEAAAVTPGPISRWILAEGTARALRRRSLAFTQSGDVVFIAKDRAGKPLKEGSRVRGPRPGERHGQLLASVDRRDHINNLEQARAAVVAGRKQLADAEVELAKASSAARLAATNLRRSEALYQNRALSLSALERQRLESTTAKASKRQARLAVAGYGAKLRAAKAARRAAAVALERSSIFAPFDGVIARLNIRKGELFRAEHVDPRTPASLLSTSPLTIIALGEVELTLEVPFYEAQHLAPEQRAVVALGGSEWHLRRRHGRGAESGDLGVVLEGKVYSVSPLLEPTARTVRVKARFRQPRALLKDGMFVSCWIEVGRKKKALRVPHGALLFAGDGAHVFVEVEGRAQRRGITLGWADERVSEVLSGLEAGARVITRGRRLLRQGTPIVVRDATTAAAKGLEKDAHGN